MGGWMCSCRVQPCACELTRTRQPTDHPVGRMAALGVTEPGDVATTDLPTRLRRPIDMQDVRLAVGEGDLSPMDILAGCNAEMRRRADVAAGVIDRLTAERDAATRFGERMFVRLWDAFTDAQWEIEVNDLVCDDAVACGLVESVDFDPEVHDDPQGACEAGDSFYVLNDVGRAALRAARAALRPGDGGEG